LSSALRLAFSDFCFEIGFVFRKAPEGLILIRLCGKEGCVHFAYFEIGFVLALFFHSP